MMEDKVNCVNFYRLLSASDISDPIWFFIVARLMGFKGEKTHPFIKKYFNWFSLVFVVLLIGGFLVIKWIH
jgi:hypothetical protein